MKSMSFVSAMKDYFGLKEGQSLNEFAQELRNLSPADKAWFQTNLATVGYEITSPAIAA